MVRVNLGERLGRLFDNVEVASLSSDVKRDQYKRNTLTLAIVTASTVEGKDMAEAAER